MGHNNHHRSHSKPIQLIIQNEEKVERRTDMRVGNITQLTNNERVLNVNNIPQELVKSFSNHFPLKHEFVKLYPECGDWEAWYMDGKLITEGHKVMVDEILDIISNVFPNTYESIEISDEKAEEGFTEDLKDML